MSNSGPVLTTVYTAGAEVLMGTLRWDKEADETRRDSRRRSEYAQNNDAHRVSMKEREKKTGADRDTTLVLLLYIAAGAPNSVQAVDNIKKICQEYYKGACQLEIIDVLEHPEKAMTAGILVTPTLVKLSPVPAAQVIGNLSDREKVLLVIGSGDENHE